MILAQQTTTKQDSNVLPSRVRNTKMDGVIEPSRISRPRNMNSPPEPPIDYDMSPSPKKIVPSPFRSVVHTTVSPPSSNVSNVYHAERVNASYRTPERRVDSSLLIEGSWAGSAAAAAAAGGGDVLS